MLTHLHDRLVLQGDFDACEELIDKAVRGIVPLQVTAEFKITSMFFFFLRVLSQILYALFLLALIVILQYLILFFLR